MTSDRSNENDVNAIKADALREAASDLYLTRPGEHNEHTAVWLRRRANLIDPRTRAEVCEHGYPLGEVCHYCAEEATRD